MALNPNPGQVRAAEVRKNDRTDYDKMLKDWMGKCYSTSLLDSGDYTTVSAAFGAALAEDSNLKTAAREKLESLMPINRARGGRDHITAQHIKFLNDAGVV